MIDYYNCGFFLSTETEIEPGKISHDVNLWHYDDEGIGEKIGSVFHEERTWEDFRMKNYTNSDGITEAYSELPDGNRMTERYDAVKGIYECYTFDKTGTLLRKEKQDANGCYEITQWHPDGTSSTESGVSLFAKTLNGTVPKI